MNQFHINRLAGYLCGIIAMLIAGWLIMGTITLSGVSVPTDLATLTKSATVEGYKPPASIPSNCTEASKITDQVRKDIKSVTLAKPQECNYMADAMRKDAAWGALAAIVAAGLIIGGWVLAGDTFNINRLAFIAVVVGVFVIGSWARPGEWLEDIGVIAEVFWRGFFAAGAIVVGGIVAHQWHESMGHD